MSFFWATPVGLKAQLCTSQESASGQPGRNSRARATATFTPFMTMKVTSANLEREGR